ncbi:MAG: hypothetical protein NTW75_03940 [Planctomycetales bacterium]|jgi:predicted dehydrogenase|nr:hypothetical protein [Planctomycetales bacterium]
MASVEKVFGIGIVGSSPISRFVCERLSIAPNFRLVAFWDSNTDGRTGSTSYRPVESGDCRHGSTPFEVMRDPGVQVVFFADGMTGDLMQMALRMGKSIVVESPYSLSREVLEQISRDGDECQLVAAIFEPRRWDVDFLHARSVVESGHLGRLLRARYSVHNDRLPGESFLRGIENELGSRILDQLLVLVDASRVTSVLWRSFPVEGGGSDGFLAVLEIPDAISVMIEIQTRSLLSVTSGWMLEGDAGAYRNGRLYTRTSDGEIVDAVLPIPSMSNDPFFEVLARSLSGEDQKELPTVRDATRVASLLANSTSGGIQTGRRDPEALSASNRATA